MSTQITTTHIESALEVFQTAPLVLKQNQESTEKALKAGQSLLDTISAEGMNDAIDEACNDYLVKLKKTTTAMNERRKPITQIMDEFKKLFTAEESKVDQKSDIYTTIQQHRDKWAAEKARIVEQKRREAALKAEQEKEEAVLASEAESMLKSNAVTFATQKIEVLNKSFRGITLANEANARIYFDEKHDHIGAGGEEIIGKVEYTAKFITQARANEIISKVKAEKLAANVAYASELIHEHQQELRSKINERIDELHAIEEAAKESAERAAQMEAERKAREQEAELKAKAEAERLKKEADALAEANKQAAITNAEFDHSVTMAEIATEQPAKVREGYSITVLKSAGWLPIVAFYFEREGNGKTPEELEKKTLLQMKTFCEKWAAKGGEQLQSPFLRYTETFKAVATKK